MQPQQRLSSGVVVDEERRGWMLQCPSCKRAVRYTVLNIVAGEPFLYSDTTSDFALREEDSDTVRRLVEERAPEVTELRQIYESIAESLPPCPNGGRFAIWSNVKCPHCRYEFPYNQGVKSERLRYFDTKIIWVEGATAFRGATMPSNRLVRVLVAET